MKKCSRIEIFLASLDASGDGRINSSDYLEKSSIDLRLEMLKLISEGKSSQSSRLIGQSTNSHDVRNRFDAFKESVGPGLREAIDDLSSADAEKIASTARAIKSMVDQAKENGSEFTKLRAHVALSLQRRALELKNEQAQLNCK